MKQAILDEFLNSIYIHNKPKSISKKEIREFLRNLATKPIYGNDYGNYLQFNEAFFRAVPIFKIGFVPVEPSEPSEPV